MKGAKQTTLRDQVAVSGIGVHSGLPVTLTLHPADDDTGIVFQRVAADGSVEREIRADVRAVTATEFATVLGDAAGPLCSTAEHLLAALRGLGVDNVIVEIDGPEVPIMDGSAAAFRRCHRSGRPDHARAAAPLHRSDQAGARRQGWRASANCGPTTTASASRPRSNSIIR